MHDNTNFYDNLDLKYPEIAISIDPIDRTNPGKIRFIIPILTPNMNNNKYTSNTVRQNTQNLMNADTKNLDIKNIELSNYITIPVPKEMCSTFGDFDICPESYINLNGNVSISGNQSGSGTMRVSIETSTGSFSVSGEVSGNFSSGSEISGKINILPSGDNRFIEAGSKWIVVFIGGDVTKPRIIGRYLDD